MEKYVVLCEECYNEELITKIYIVNNSSFDNIEDVRSFMKKDYFCKYRK